MPNLSESMTGMTKFSNASPPFYAMIPNPYRQAYLRTGFTFYE